MYAVLFPSYLEPSQLRVDRVTSHACCRAVERGKSCEKQTLILVMIGVILFIAGSAIAYAAWRRQQARIVRCERRGSGEHVGRRGQGEHPGRHDRSGHGVQRLVALS